MASNCRLDMGLLLSDVSAVLITRGDVDLSPIIASLPFEDVVISSGGKRCMLDRYLAVGRAKHDLIYTQDDDCLVDILALLEHYEPGKVLCNMPMKKRAEYPDGIALVGWGSLFHKSACGVLGWGSGVPGSGSYLQKWPWDALFERTADRVFTGLNPLKLCDVPFEHLPHAYGQDRMGAQKTHLQDLADIRQRIYACRA